MAKLKTLRGLPFNLAHSYFSTLNYYLKGYMSDWIVNASYEKGINYLEIDLINDSVTPKELQIVPLVPQTHARKMISHYLLSNGFDKDFINEAKFEIQIKENRVIICNCVIKTVNDNIFRSKGYVEQSYIEFSVIKKESIKTNSTFLNWLKTIFLNN
ncbi:MAG: hypothetical protein Q8940_18175 [Bacteroidota bacterium]|nr:hypothetical protein [Bacteroidota bacterium]